MCGKNRGVAAMEESSNGGGGVHVFVMYCAVSVQENRRQRPVAFGGEAVLV